MFLITKTSYDNLTRNFQSRRKIIVRFSCNQAPDLYSSDITISSVVWAAHGYKIAF